MKDEGYDVEMDQIPMRPAAVLIKLNPDGTIEDALQSWITRCFRRLADQRRRNYF